MELKEQEESCLLYKYVYKYIYLNSVIEIIFLFNGNTNHEQILISV